MPYTILLTDSNTRKTLSATRSLGKAEHTVINISQTKLAPAFYSKYCAKHYITKNPDEDPEQFFRKILAVVIENKVDIIIPMDESSCFALLDHRTEVEKYAQLALPDSRFFNIASDKWLTLEFASKFNIPTPKSQLPSTPSKIKEAINEIKFPIVIKPRRSSGSRGIKIAYNQNEFDEFYPSVLEKYGVPILQEYIQSTSSGIGVGMVAIEGKIIETLTYERLREFPIKGGPGTLHHPIINHDAENYARVLIENLEWHGAAMVEYRIETTTGKPILMEINPRFWGSLQTSAIAGINFPDILVKGIMGDKIQLSTKKSDIFCRWFLPGDIAHFIANPKRFNLKPSFFQFWGKKLYYDQFDKTDWKGNIAVWIICFLSIFNIKTLKKRTLRK